MAGARYDAAAEFYVDGWPDTYDDPASQSLLSVLGSVEGLDVLDVACGHGRYTREILRRGARHGVGLDLSPELVRRAESVEAEQPLGASYLCADLAAADGIVDGSFDRVVCGFGLSDVDDLDGAVRQVARVLRPEGRFVFSILHPCFPGSDGVSASWPPGGSYYDEQFWFADSDASTLRNQVGANHRMLSTYLDTLIDNGLVVSHVEEPRPTGDWAASQPAAAVLPVYLVIGCTKR
jgi:SAM-dependent methyltransferase